jgi:hypothetical protein
VWWVGAAILVSLGAGGIRFWRNRWIDNPTDEDETFDALPR